MMGKTDMMIDMVIDKMKREHPSSKKLFVQPTLFELFVSAPAGTPQCEALPPLKGKRRQAADSDSKDSDSDSMMSAETLRAFDLQAAYGPSLGLSRTERWLRAASARPAAENPPCRTLAMLRPVPALRAQTWG